MNEHDMILYMAAYFDARGFIHLTEGSPGHRAQLRISITHQIPDILYLFKKRYGCSVTKTGVSYMMQAISGKAETVLRELLPYLILKKDLVECALEYQSLVGYRADDVVQARDTILKTFRALKEI